MTTILVSAAVVLLAAWAMTKLDKASRKDWTKRRLATRAKRRLARQKNRYQAALQPWRPISFLLAWTTILLLLTLKALWSLLTLVGMVSREAMTRQRKTPAPAERKPLSQAEVTRQIAARRWGVDPSQVEVVGTTAYPVEVTRTA